MRLLLVEDDELIGDGTKAGLTQEGHTVDWVKDGASALHAMKSEHFDLMILDLGLPRMSGLEVLEKTRSEGNTTPVLILTARDSVEDRVKGLDAGADDYLVKPFILEELSARIRALLRRGSEQAGNTLVHGDVEMDPAAHTVTFQGEAVTLSRREFALLQKLMQNVGRVLSRENLVQTLYGWDEEIDSNALEVHIHNIRKKFGSKFIKTIRGIGYMIEKQKSDDES